MLTVELITKAYFLSNIVGRDLSAVEGSQLADGLDLLNEILGEQSADGKYIPYFNHDVFPAVPGQELYFMPLVVSVDAVTYNIGVVRYKMARVNRTHYFSTPRVDNITSLPYQYYIERTNGGSNLYLYFLPSSTIDDINVTSKGDLTDLTANEVISDNFDRYYLSYLKYKLASRICDFNDITFTPAKEARLRSLEKRLLDISEHDLTVETISPFTDSPLVSMAQVNIGRGYYP